MAGFFTIKNYDRYQHYKDRNPPWIKLYFDLLNDYEFGKLTDQAKAHLLQMGLLASRQPENQIPYDAEWVAKRINATTKVNLEAFVAAGWIILSEDASNALASCKRSATPEKEKQVDTETEKDSCPAWLPKEAWSGYVESRKAQKAEMTPRAEMLAIKTLDRLRAQGHDPAAVLDQSVQNGWKGLFLIKQEHTHGRDRKPTSTDRHLAGIASIVDDIRAGRTGGTQTGA